MEIGEKIRRLRILNNLTQEELADRAELSKGFISQLERDLTSPSILTLSASAPRPRIFSARRNRSNWYSEGRIISKSRTAS